jgi:hypothetical protein
MNRRPANTTNKIRIVKRWTAIKILEPMPIEAAGRSAALAARIEDSIDPEVTSKIKSSDAVP